MTTWPNSDPATRKLAGLPALETAIADAQAQAENAHTVALQTHWIETQRRLSDQAKRLRSDVAKGGA